MTLRRDAGDMPLLSFRTF